MSAYAVFEALLITLLVLFSLRLVWQRVVKPALQGPKTACGGSGCSKCAPQK